MKFKLVFYIIFLCGLHVQQIFGRTSDSLRVTLPNGSKLIGRHLNSYSGNGIRAFMGIPFAEPPVGELRFKPPQPIQPWNDELKVIKDSDLCIQRDPFRRDMEIVGSEDCLYLNVYTPQFAKPSSLLPVMVFFHGGGYQCGSGISDFYGPEILLDHDIIFIGTNFRLGPLGFLSTGQEDCPGNNGLKDQTMALRWVQENIKSFGGDPNQVTIFGESAGGASVTYHMMSPLSKGLFNKGISQSGTNLTPWGKPAHKGIAEKRAKQLADWMGCSSNDWKNIINCLRTVDAGKITSAFYDYFEWDTDPMVPFPPVVEPDLPGAFITKHPTDELTPHSISIPWLTGITSDEGAMKSAPIINLPELNNDFIQNFDKALPIALNYDHHSKDLQEIITKKINKFYFKNKELNSENHQNLTNLFTDGWFLAAMDEYLRIRLEQKTAGPTYVYLFSHKGAYSFTEIFGGGPETYYGTCHAEELQFLFPIGKELFSNAVPTKEDIEIRKILGELWVNFAKTGNPTPSSTLKDGNQLKWLPTTGYPLKYLRIGNKDCPECVSVKMETGLYENRVNFWKDLNAHSPRRQSLDKSEL